MKHLLLTLATLAIVLPSFAQQPDAVYKLIRQQWIVNEDGSSDYRYRHEVQILRNRALTAYADKGETFVVYNPDLEELVVNEVYTIQSDGRRVNMPQNAFVYQLPQECASCGRFAHMRELAMVHTGMELGCTVVVDYSIHRRYNLVNQTVSFAKDCPVERWEVSIALPEDQELEVAWNQPQWTDLTYTEKRTPQSLYVVAQAVPQRYVDSYLPEASLLYPSVHFFNGTPDYWPAFDSRGLPEADKTIDMLYASKNVRDNVLALRNYVVDNIHLNDISPDHLGYRHATASEVWQSGCGTATDKAVLLAAMINQMGYQARVIGEGNDEVGVRIDTLEYRLDVRTKAPMALIGQALDEVDTTILKEKGIVPALDTLGDGFYRLQFAHVQGEPTLQAGMLAAVRVAPLQADPCCLDVDVTYQLPKGLTVVGSLPKEKMDYPGIGSLEISVKQSGSKLRVVRRLTLEQSIVGSEQYAAYRKLLTAWQTTNSLLLRDKKVQ